MTDYVIAHAAVCTKCAWTSQLGKFEDDAAIWSQVHQFMSRRCVGSVDVVQVKVPTSELGSRSRR